MIEDECSAAAGRQAASDPATFIEHEGHQTGRSEDRNGGRSRDTRADDDDFAQFKDPC